MSHDHPIDLTPTLREMTPNSFAVWHNFTRAGTIVGLAVAVLLLLMLVVFVIL
jgi:hypothetical protein